MQVLNNEYFLRRCLGYFYNTAGGDCSFTLQCMGSIRIHETQLLHSVIITHYFEFYV